MESKTAVRAMATLGIINIAVIVHLAYIIIEIWRM